MVLKVLKKEIFRKGEMLYRVEAFHKKLEFVLLANGNLSDIKDVTDGTRKEVSIGVQADLCHVFYNSEHVEVPQVSILFKKKMRERAAKILNKVNAEIAVTECYAGSHTGVPCEGLYIDNNGFVCCAHNGAGGVRCGMNKEDSNTIDRYEQTLR